MEIFRCFGDKKEIEAQIRDIIPYAKVSISSDCLDNIVRIGDIEEDDYYDLLDELDDIIYSDSDISLEETFVSFLANNNLMASAAESCTGGLLSSSIVNISGASKVFYEGIVSYNCQSKIDRLGVASETLEEYGAVSEQTASEMAYGLLGNEVDIGIAITGIAGPEGGTEEKPVGLVYVGIASMREAPFAIKCQFYGTREQIRMCAKNAALFYALQFLRENY